MAKKFTDGLDDDILETKRPAGCIGGIFQLFDCQQLLGGKQLSEQGNNRRESSGHAPESSCISLSCNLEKNQSRRSQDNPRYSMESSRTSFSSTFTSFSSLEHKSPQDKPIHTQQSGGSPRNTDNNKSLAFKEIIKESIYRDLCSTTVKEDDKKRNKVMESIHSPRPMDSSKANHLDESLRIMFKLKDSPRSFYEGYSPRFSYDGTEVSSPFNNVKQHSKHSELSRLSLDSKESSLKCNLGPKFSSAMKEYDNNGNKRVPASLNQLQDLENNEKNSSIIAKLMGLDPLKSGTQSSIRCYDPFSEQKNQIAHHERKDEKPLNSPRNIVRSPRRNNLQPDSPTKFSVEENPLMAVGYVEKNMDQKIKSVLNKVEKRLQKLQCHHSSKELRDLKRVLLETSKNGNKKLSSVNSSNTQLTAPKKVCISERASKPPIVIMEPAKKLDVSFSKVTKLEGLSVLGKIRTSDSKSNRKKDFLDTQTNAGKSFTENKAKWKGAHSLSKEQNEKALNNTVSPRLQHMKPGMKITASAAVPSYEANKSPRLAVNSQLLDSGSPRCKLRNKQNKVQDIELQNSGEQVNVEAIRAKNSNEVKSPLFKQTVKVDTEVSLASETKKHGEKLKDHSASELNLVSPPRSCPKSESDTLLNQDGLLHSPVSVSKVFKDYQNLPSDHNFNMIRTSTASSRNKSQILKSKNTTIQGSRDLGTTINKVHVTNATEVRLSNATMFTPENQDQDCAIVNEIFLVDGLLQKESDLLSMLEYVISNKPSEFVQKSNPQRHRHKHPFDVVNEILTHKLDVTSFGSRSDHMLHFRIFSNKLPYKELRSEIKCIRSCEEGNSDDNWMNHKDVLWPSRSRNCFESEIPLLAVEIERLIFKDLINEVVNGVTTVALDAKQRHQKPMFAKYVN